MKYVIKKDDAYVACVTFAKIVENDGYIYVYAFKQKEVAVTFEKKYLAEAIAKAIEGTVEELE